MSRPRTHDTKLPKYVRIKSGSYYHRDIKLCRVADGESAMYQKLAEKLQAPAADAVPAAVEAFIRHEISHLSPSARKEHERLLRVFAHIFANFTVAQVQPWHIDKACKAKYAAHPSAAHHFKSRVSTFFRWTILRQMRTDNPCAAVRLQKIQRKRSPWTDQLFLDVRDQLHPMLQVYHDLSFLLAQRTTDVRLLERAHIGEQSIRVEPSKTLHSSGAAVDLPITTEIRAVLERAAQIQRTWRIVCPYIICTPQGTAYTRSGIYTAYKRADEALHAGKRIGLNPKALRRYALSKAHAEGYSKEQLQVTAAHARLGTTEGYLESEIVPVSAVVMRLPKR